MDTEQLISLFHTGFIICLVLTILFAALSIFLFFFLRIRNVFDNMTGRAEKRTIRMMEEENAKTGKLRQDYFAANTSGSLYTTPSGNIPPVVYAPAAEDDGSAKTDQPHLYSEDLDKYPVKPEQIYPPAEGSEETALLGAGDEATTLLNAGGEETTLLSQTASAGRYSPDGAPGETVLLTPQMEQELEAARAEEKPKFPGKFEIIKENIWIHTEELI